MGNKYRLFQEVWAFIQGLGIGRCTVSKVICTHTTEQQWPMGKPVFMYSYEVQLQGQAFMVSQDEVDLSKARLEKRYPNGI